MKRIEILSYSDTYFKPLYQVAAAAVLQFLKKKKKKKVNVLMQNMGMEQL